MKGMDTYSLLPENEYTEVENRRYLVPTLGVTQTNDFIDNLRANQRTQNAQINQQTQNLGTKIPSVMGGLTGGTGYWTSRYQTPQTNMAAASLRAASQADALKTALANEKSYWQKKYQDAYRAYQKSAYDKAQAAQLESQKTIGDVEYEDTTDLKDIVGSTPGVPGGYTVASIDTENDTPLGYTYVPYGQDYKTNYNYSLGGISVDPVGKLSKWDATRKRENGQNTLGWTLPSGQRVLLSQYPNHVLVWDANGNYYVRDTTNDMYTYVGR